VSATIISYPPSAGGNHLKNMMCCGTTFGNSSDLKINIYTDPIQPPGTVHSRPGRNVDEREFDKARDEQLNYIIHGHFGELAPHRDKINAIPDRKYVLITINDQRDQQLLTSRQSRLGDRKHPYYNNEEQPFLYQPPMYTTYFSGGRNDVYTVALYELWHPDLKQYNIIDRLNNFLDVNIDHTQAQHLHDLWWKNNFNFEFSNFERTMYGKACN
jgi:hypothetical protein